MRTGYLSGPINSTTPDGLDSAGHKEVFADVQRFMGRNYGNWQIVNPVEVGTKCVDPKCGPFDGHSWNCWLKADLKAMLDCETIIMLPHWQHSPGANLEKMVADAVGMTVVYAIRTEMNGWVIR